MIKNTKYIYSKYPNSKHNEKMLLSTHVTPKPSVTIYFIIYSIFSSSKHSPLGSFCANYNFFLVLPLPKPLESQLSHGVLE